MAQQENDRADISELQVILKELLFKETNIEFAYVFGSQVKKTHRFKSDLDIAVFFNSALNSVDFPALGSPTIPTDSDMMRLYQNESQCYGLSMIIEILSTAAKLTQHRYGISNHADGFDICVNCFIVRKINSHRAMIAKPAKSGECKPKNSIDQPVLSMS